MRKRGSCCLELPLRYVIGPLFCRLLREITALDERVLSIACPGVGLRSLGQSGMRG